MTPEGAIATAARAARLIIPDLADTPLYVIQPCPGSLIDRHLTQCKPGLYYRNLVLAMQPQLESKGLWKGRGVGIICDAVLCYASAIDDDYGARRVMGVILHELCHWLDAPETAAISATPLDDFRESCSEEK